MAERVILGVERGFELNALVNGVCLEAYKLILRVFFGS
jgi:hypothetical protein